MSNENSTQPTNDAEGHGFAGRGIEEADEAVDTEGHAYSSGRLDDGSGDDAEGHCSSNR